VTAPKVNEDGNLPLALRELWHAIDSLTETRTTFVNGAAVHAPSLLDQLIDDMGGQQGNAYGGVARSLPPAWVDATDLIAEIQIAVDAWQCGLPPLPRPKHLVHATTARVQQLAKRPWRPQDVHALEQITKVLLEWCAQIQELLNPTTKWSLPNPCPACNTATVYRRDSAGDIVRQPALQIGPHGCQCQRCHQLWEPAYFQHLANVLGYQLPAGVLE
jgi:hypothetical protein